MQPSTGHLPVPRVHAAVPASSGATPVQAVPPSAPRAPASSSGLPGSADTAARAALGIERAQAQARRAGAGPLPLGPAGHAGPVDPATRIRSIERCAAAAGVLAKALSPEAVDIAQVTAVTHALQELLQASHPHETQVDRVLVSFLKEAIHRDKAEFIESFVETVAAAAPDLITAQRQRGLLMGLASPLEPSKWMTLADDALTQARAPAPGHPLLAQGSPYIGVPLLSRLCTLGRDKLQAGTYFGMQAFACAVLDSHDLDPLLKREVILSRAPTPHRAGVSYMSAARLAMASGNVGAACALMHALSRWADSAEALQLSIRMRVSPAEVCVALREAELSGDPWVEAARRSWGPSIEVFAHEAVFAAAAQARGRASATDRQAA